MRNLLMVLVFALSSAAAAKSKIRFTRYRSWNSRMYPVWKDGDVRFRDCWAGGEVAFDVKNDAPTLTGAKATFNIDIRFPQNQTVLPDGQVVWARNCTINGTQYREGEAVYPVPDQELNGVFPDGTPFNRISNRKSRYVFVWKAWGRYWQVADGPSSTLTIGTDNVPLGSYTMELVIYHCRGKDRFVPLGYASTTFSITDQVPFAVSLSQVNDINQADQTFIQNRAVAFTINLHDPSQYLSTADITFNWNFGDDSGTLISRERMVTHTYLTPGSFRPEVVLMASISNGCAEPTTAIPTVIPTTSTPADAPPAPVPTEDATDMAVIVPASEVIPTEVIPTDASEVIPTDASEVIPTDASEVIPTDASEVIPTDDLSLAASEATANLATDTDTAAEAADAEAVTPEEGDAAAAAPAAEDPAATVDLAAGAAAEVDATAEDANAAAAEEAAVPAAEGAAALPVAPVTEEPDVAAADNDAAAAEEAAAAEADVPAVDAAASATPEVEGEEATVDLAATILPEAPDAATVLPEAPAAATVLPEAPDAATVLPEAPAAATVLPEAAAAATVIAPALELAAEGEAEAEVAAATEVAEAEAVAPVENAIVPVATEATAVEEAEPAAPAADAEAEIVNEVAASAVPAAINEVAIPAEGEVAAEMEVEAGTEAAQVALVLAKRQAPELEANNCMVYRTGSFSTPVDIIEGIESAEIIEVANVVTLTAEVEQNAVDLTITCQGSLPNEVCTVISDADCTTPVQTVCNAVTPSPECQMVLRQFFNDSGVFCINVSLTNDVSLAVASARVSVTVGSNTSIAGTVAMVLGAMVLVCAIGTIALTYRRFKPYRPLREDSAGTSVGSSVITSVPLLLWNLLSRQSAGESRPLLQGRVV